MSKETEEQNVDRVYTRTSLPINEELYWLQQPVIIITEDDDSSFDVSASLVLCSVPSRRYPSVLMLCSLWRFRTS
jgi:hypothetical protein